MRNAESGRQGWSVHDVVAHLGALFWAVADPSQLAATTDVPTELARRQHVAARRSWSTDRVVDDYRSVSADAIERPAGLAEADFEVPLGDLGTFPASILPNAFSFDHYTHIRLDLFAPRGPLFGSPPPADQLQLAPALVWIATALPQQNTGPIAALSGTVELQIVGAAAQTIAVGSGPVSAQITGDAPALVRWITKRATWAEADVTATGDVADLALARALHVFSRE